MERPAFFIEHYMDDKECSFFYKQAGLSSMYDTVI